MSENDLSLEDLFISKRLNTAVMKPRHWLVFTLYFPFGCVIALTRFVLVFVFGLVVPEAYRYRVFRAIGGLICTYKCKLDVPENGALILANHCNYLDPIVLNAVLSKPSHLATVIWQGVNFFSQLICRPTVAVVETGKNRTFLKSLSTVAKRHNVVIFPEGTVTDNTCALLQFQRSVFRLEHPIYLVAIRYHRAFPFLQGKAMSRQMGIEVLVDLFQPWTRVELIPIGEFNKTSYPTTQAQADAAQQKMANALGVRTSRWTSKDRHKRLFP